MRHLGECHCGKLKVSFVTHKAPAELGVRTCQCDFCRRVGAVNCSDPEGEVVVEGKESDIERYRFGMKTADFLICRHCGVYVAAVIGKAPDIRSTINAAGLRMKDFLGLREAPMEYGAESPEHRVARRFKNWTPTRFSDPALDASDFGPHQH